jgi:8-oxo-dGTP pyrophosphatase MutT (NUDIX family)
VITPFFYKIVRTIKNGVLRMMNLKTVGARALVISQDQVLLIKHTYQKGWYTIGGAVEKNESPLQAIVRELWEEVGLIPLEKPDFFALYHSNFEKRDDYIAFYIVTKFEMQAVSSPEIADKKWFALTDLPHDVTPATKRRIEEFLACREKSDKW